MIASGSTVDITLTSVTTTDTADAIIQKVSQTLASDGRLTVRSTQVLGNIWNAVMGTISSLSINQPFQMEIKVQTNVAFSGTDDPLSIVANALYTVTGEYPTTLSTISITPPGGMAATSTGEAAPNPAGPGGPQGTGSSIADAISRFFSDLTSTAKSLLIGLVAIIIIALVLIAYGPNVGSIARARA
jgi:hypothetical protein